jgi:hypothetical protein
MSKQSNKIEENEPIFKMTPPDTELIFKMPPGWIDFSTPLGVLVMLLEARSTQATAKEKREEMLSTAKFIRENITSLSFDPEKKTFDYKIRNETLRGEVSRLVKKRYLTDLLQEIYGLIIPEKADKKLTKIAIHTITQFYGDSKQLSLFSDNKIDSLSSILESRGIEVGERPESYGVLLNQSQRRVLEGILKAFSDSNYKGDEQIDRDSYDKVHPVNKIPLAYNLIDKIPVVKLTQADIIRLSGYDRTQGDKADVIDAINFLATKPFCFYWVRLKTENGKPVIDKAGKYVKEEVTEVGSIFRIKYVKNPESGELQYYEIHPSAPLLDQVNSYFLLVPNNWRDEVKQLTGKRASSYSYEFLFWLRLQYEQIRRNNTSKKPKPFQLSKTWEEVAIALKMPESMYKANRKRASKIIKDAYDVAIKLGYLIKVENNGATDTLYLNEDYYPKPGQLV